MLKEVNYKKGTNNLMLWYYPEKKKSSNEDMSEFTMKW